MRLKTSVIATVIIVAVVVVFVCAPKKDTEEVLFNSLDIEYPAGEILQTKGIDTIEYPSFEDAVILSGYDSLTILESITKGNKVDDYEFSPK